MVDLPQPHTPITIRASNGRLLGCCSGKVFKLEIEKVFGGRGQLFAVGNWGNFPDQFLGLGN